MAPLRRQNDPATSACIRSSSLRGHGYRPMSEEPVRRHPRFQHATRTKFLHVGQPARPSSRRDGGPESSRVYRTLESASLAVTGSGNRVSPIMSASAASTPPGVRITPFGPIAESGCARHGIAHKPPRLMAVASGLMTGPRRADPASQRTRPRGRARHFSPTGCASRADAGIRPGIMSDAFVSDHHRGRVEIPALQASPTAPPPSTVSHLGTWRLAVRDQPHDVASRRPPDHLERGIASLAASFCGLYAAVGS